VRQSVQLQPFWHDRILATVIGRNEAATAFPSLLVTRDFNLQNKAELADIPYIEAPDPA